MNELVTIYKDAFTKNYFNFKGRVRRRDYFLFGLINMVLAALAGIISVNAGVDLRAVVLTYLLVVTIPSFGFAFRRLHDSGKSGWWLLVTFIPIIGGLIFFILMIIPGMKGDNKYGPDPKAIRQF